MSGSEGERRGLFGPRAPEPGDPGYVAPTLTQLRKERQRRQAMDEAEHAAAEERRRRRWEAAVAAVPAWRFGIAVATWSLGLAMATWLAGPVHWRLGLLAVGAGISAAALAPRRGPLAAAVLAIGAGSLFISGTVDLTESRPAQAVLALVLVGAAMRASPLPRMVGTLVVLVGLVQAVRLAIVGTVDLEAALVLAGPILVATLAVGLGTAAAPASRIASLALAGAGGFVLFGAWQDLTAPPQDQEDVRRMLARGVLERHLETVATQPDFARAALRERPRWHALGRRIQEEAGLEGALATGWDPTGGALIPGDVIVAATWFEERGQGGRGRRLLHSEREHPIVAWHLHLFSRLQGVGEPPVAIRPPAAAPRLPGRHQLDWAFYSNDARSIDFHAETPLRELVLELWAESYFGNPEILVEIDGRGVKRAGIPEGEQTLELRVTLPEGPHRLRISYDNDLQNEQGDRNVGVRAVSGS